MKIPSFSKLLIKKYKMIKRYRIFISYEKKTADFFI